MHVLVICMIYVCAHACFGDLHELYYVNALVCLHVLVGHFGEGREQKRGTAESLFFFVSVGFLGFWRRKKRDLEKKV